MSDSFFAPRKSVVILDPAITTRNAGDEIISDAARRWTRTALPKHFLTTAPTHERMGIRSHRLIRQSECAIVGGSNILTSSLYSDRGWRVGARDMVFVNKLILLAAGWRDYEAAPSLLTKLMLKRLLHPTALHSVRDTHTKEMLEKAGIKNVVVTACVTMWQLTAAHLSMIPKGKAKSVVTTLNMRQPSHADSRLLEILMKQYDKVYIWPQGFDDLEYVTKLSNGRAEIISPTLEAYDELLTSDESLDYVGNRLHGGIRALQKGRRAFIVSIDNRAAEIGKDTGLPIFSRQANEDEIVSLISSPYEPTINLPLDAIQSWIGQFRS